MFAKIKKFFTNVIGGFIKAHSFIASCIVFGLVTVVVVAVVFAVGGFDRKNPGTGEEVSTEESTELPEDVNRYVLECNTNAEVKTVMEEYHKALAEDNEEVIKKYLLYVNENDLDNIAVKSQYIDGYEDINCYTQKGLAENSYYVYVSYMLALKDFEDRVPGVIGFYYCPDENGEYHIFREDDLSEDVYTDLMVAFTEPDVQSLYKNVALDYNSVIDSNDELKEYMDGFEDMVRDDMIERIAIRTASEELVAASEQASIEASENAENKLPGADDIVEPTTTVNVRSSDSETADKLGKVSPGTKLTRLEEKINGWSRVMYEGSEGYVKTEFLTVVSAAGSTGGTDVAGTGTYVTVKENVNIRASASQTGEKVALAVAGDKLEVIEKRTDGWTKIKYNGKEAYVKSEFVE
ncbi:MAG: SH3 domain-containing protein [Lachnospiraceae bacterium]|nr:SH3 domain-containing protein [Lachnospiraceae bacterium]